MSFALFKDLLEAGSYLATIIGIPVAFWVFLYQKRKDRAEAELASYLQANEKYVQYLALCLEHSELVCFDLDMNEPGVAKSGMDIRRLTLFEILFSTLETGYLLYRNHKSNIRDTQWRGWQEYLKYWTRRTDFQEAWSAAGGEFDSDFDKMIEELIHEANAHKRKASSDPIASQSRG